MGYLLLVIADLKVTKNIHSLMSHLQSPLISIHRKTTMLLLFAKIERITTKIYCIKTLILLNLVVLSFAKIWHCLDWKLRSPIDVT